MKGKLVSSPNDQKEHRLGHDDESLKSDDCDFSIMSESSSIITVEDDDVIGLASSNPAESVPNEVGIFLSEKENERRVIQRRQKESPQTSAYSVRPTLSLGSIRSDDTLRDIYASPSCSGRFIKSPRFSGAFFRPAEKMKSCYRAAARQRDVPNHPASIPRHIETRNDSSFGSLARNTRREMRSLELSPTCSGRTITPRNYVSILDPSESYGAAFRRLDHRAAARLLSPEAMHKRSFAINSPSWSHNRSKSNRSQSVRFQDFKDSRHAMHCRSSFQDI